MTQSEAKTQASPWWECPSRKAGMAKQGECGLLASPCSHRLFDSGGLRWAEPIRTLSRYCPAGPVLNIGGAKTLLSWDRLVLCELVED
jgi:hypothetical protein